MAQIQINGVIYGTTDAADITYNNTNVYEELQTLSENKANKDIVENLILNLDDRTPITDLLAEAEKGVSSRRIVYCNSNTLNTPYKENLTSWGNGIAIITGFDIDTATILYIPNGIQRIFMNSKQHGAWLGWRDFVDEITTLNKKFYTSKTDVDLNTITTAGFYGVANSDANVNLNFPIGTNGILLVMQYGGTPGARGRQIFFRVGTIDSNDHNWYSRQFITSDGVITFGAWEQIVTDKILDAALASYLPRAGGTMTGNILWGATDVEIKHSSGNTANRTMVRGGFTYNDGASLYLNGKDRSADPGVFTLSASDGTSSKSLTGKPDGTLTWGSTNVATATDLSKYLPLTGGTMTGTTIWLDGGRGRIITDDTVTQIENYTTAKDNNNRTTLSVYNGNALNTKARLRTVIDGTTSNYNLYGTHNITSGTSAYTAGTTALTTGAIHLVYS